MTKKLNCLLLCIIFYTQLNGDILKLTTDEWYPYTSKNNNGFIENIITKTLENSKIKYEIDYNNFDVGFNSSIQKSYNGTFPYFFTKERGEKFYYSLPIFEVENVLFYNKEKFNNDIQNINKYKIGIVKGYAYKNIDINKFNNVIYLDNEIMGFDMLDKGEIDLLPSNKLVGIHIIKKYFNDFYTNIDYLKNKYITTDTLHLILNKNDKNNKNYMDLFNKSLKELKKNGDYKRILLNNRKLIKTNLANVIRLVNNTESFPMVVATETPDSKEKYMIPRGTKAIVLEWSKHFKEKGILKIYNEMFNKTKIMIVNGPLRGKTLYVENMYIEIE